MSTEYNDKVLNAWNQWKEICFVAGCSPDEQAILGKEIHKAFAKRFETVVSADQAKKIMSEATTIILGSRLQNQKASENDGCSPNQESCDYDDWKTSGSQSSTGCDEDDFNKNVKKIDKNESSRLILSYWSSVFDEGIIAKTNATPLEDNLESDDRTLNGDIWKGTAKNYKNHAWNLLKESKEPPLAVIRGLLIGPKGFINAIVEYYLWQHHRILWENLQESKRNKKRTKSKTENIRNIAIISLEAPLGNAKNDDGKPLTYGDIIPGNSFSEQNERFSDILRDAKNELENFTTWELALLLARAADLQTDKVTETFLKAGHTKISDYWNNKLRRKSLSFRNFFARKEIYSLIKKRIESEEGGKLFLSKIKEAFDKKGMGELL